MWRSACNRRRASGVDLVAAHGLTPGEYVLATVHRAGNVDTAQRLAAVVDVLTAVAAQVPVLLALHPRTRARLSEFGLSLHGVAGLTLTEPLGYVELTALLTNAAAVLTDSGGLQKEAYFAGVRCVTLRPSTEWVETVEEGWNTPGRPLGGGGGGGAEHPTAE